MINIYAFCSFLFYPALLESNNNNNILFTGLIFMQMAVITGDSYALIKINQLLNWTEVKNLTVNQQDTYNGKPLSRTSLTLLTLAVCSQVMEAVPSAFTIWVCGWITWKPGRWQRLSSNLCGHALIKKKRKKKTSKKWIQIMTQHFSMFLFVFLL